MYHNASLDCYHGITSQRIIASIESMVDTEERDKQSQAWLHLSPPVLWRCKGDIQEAMVDTEERDTQSLGWLSQSLQANWFSQKQGKLIIASHNHYKNMGIPL